MNERVYIKSPRQKRAIEALLEKATLVKDLGEIIGALNPREIISQLRKQGFHNIIFTRRFATIDRDGKRCRPGEYYIPKEFSPLLEEILRNYPKLLTHDKREA